MIVNHDINLSHALFTQPGSLFQTVQPPLLPKQDSDLGSLFSMYDNESHFASPLTQKMMQV